MSTPTPPADEPRPGDQADFSLVLGGPLFQLWQRTRLAGDALQLVHRRVVFLTLLAWAPLLVLAVAQGHAWGDSVALPFLRDVEIHVRLLLALPMLVLAELIVHKRMRPVVQQFLDRDLIPVASRPKFDAAVASAMRLRNSVLAECLLIALVYGVGVLVVYRTQIALDAPTWYRVPVDGAWKPTVAGWWLVCVSVPVLQFLLLRWYFRLFVWARFLWQVSRIDLTLLPTHPDRCGGLGFLGGVAPAFAPVLVAQGTMIAGTIASKIFYAGATLPAFKVELIGLVAVMVFAILGPMLVFGPALEAAKRAGLRNYGTLAQQYVLEFDRKWLRGGAPADEPLIGSADIQSLADLGNSFEVVKGMRFVPFTLQTVLQLAVTSLLPVAPLLLTMVSLEELLTRLVQAVF